MIPLLNSRRFFSKTLKQPAYAFRVFIKRVGASFCYSFGRGRSIYPEALTLFLTYHCNLHCKMCGQWQEAGITRKKPQAYSKEELSLAEFKALIDDAVHFKPNITLFGGEPLLYRDILELIKYIKQKDMHCLMITNGSLLLDSAGDLVDSGLDELNVSLDGDSRLHDEIRAMPGLFEKITLGLKEVNRLKLKQRRKKPLVNLQCTITKYNYQYLEKLLDVAKGIEADSLTFHHLVFITEELLQKQKRFDALLNTSSAGWQGFNFEAGIEPAGLYRKIKEVLKRQSQFSVDFYPNFSFAGLKEYYQNPNYTPRPENRALQGAPACRQAGRDESWPLGHSAQSLPSDRRGTPEAKALGGLHFPLEYSGRCLSPWMTAYIFPDGEVRPCLNLDYSLGNIRKDKFRRLWNSEQAMRFRKVIKENKIFPACVRCTELYRY